MRTVSHFSVGFRALLLLTPGLLTACSGGDDDGTTETAPLPGFQGNIGNRGPNTGATNGLQPNQNGGINNAGTANNGTGNTGTQTNDVQNGGAQTGSSENGQNVNGNVNTGGTDNVNTGAGQQNPDNGDGQNDGQGAQEPDDATNNDDPVDNLPPADEVGRVASDLCPAGPFDAPLPNNPQIEVFTRQAEGVFDFFNWEGIVWVDGALYWSEIANGNAAQINRMVPGGQIERGFIPNSGTNGLAVNADGNLVGASHLPMGQISVFDLPGGNRTIGNQQFEGNFFNSPNDLVLRSDGNIYFTDPDFQSGGNRPQQNNRVYRVSAGGEVTEVDGSFQQPNGVTLSPDGNTLYVAGDGPLRAYPLDADGAPGASTTFPTQLQVPDGMTVDCAGNIYAVENSARRVQIFSPDGNQIGTIGPNGFDNQGLTNVAFGGPNRTTLFISGFVSGNQGAIYSVEMNVPGFPY